jgi:hypothetical protein
MCQSGACDRPDKPCPKCDAAAKVAARAAGLDDGGPDAGRADRLMDELAEMHHGGHLRYKTPGTKRKGK